MKTSCHHVKTVRVHRVFHFLLVFVPPVCNFCIFNRRIGVNSNVDMQELKEYDRSYYIFNETNSPKRELSNMPDKYKLRVPVLYRAWTSQK